MGTLLCLLGMVLKPACRDKQAACVALDHRDGACRDHTAQRPMTDPQDFGSVRKFVAYLFHG